MKKLILSSLLLTAITQLNAQLDSSAFSVTALTPFNSAQFISTPINSSLQFTQDFTLECVIIFNQFNWIDPNTEAYWRPQRIVTSRGSGEMCGGAA